MKDIFATFLLENIEQKAKNGSRFSPFYFQKSPFLNDRMVRRRFPNTSLIEQNLN